MASRATEFIKVQRRGEIEARLKEKPDLSLEELALYIAGKYNIGLRTIKEEVSIIKFKIGVANDI